MHLFLFWDLCAWMHCHSPVIHFSPSASCHGDVPSRIIGQVILILVGFKLQFGALLFSVSVYVFVCKGFVDTTAYYVALPHPVHVVF